MRFIQQVSGTFFLLFLVLILSGWGYTGHFKINHDASLSFNQDMDQFNAWVNTLATHGSDADDRKYTDPTEAPKHYIDIDNYPAFNVTGRIPQTFDSVINLYGINFVLDQGILPWATIIAYDSLKNCFLRNDWNKAVLFAADLGHYIGDGHMPLHITRNYNGQYTGNEGIHSRYESTMINGYISQFNYSGQEIIVIPNVGEYVFSYLYNNYAYVDSVIFADDYAQSVSSNTHSSAYKEALWEKSKNFTIPLFKNSSHALAELIYTAWVNAGSPPMSSASVADKTADIQIPVLGNSPNPFTSSTTIEFKLGDQSRVLLRVYDGSGNLIQTLIDGQKAAGTHQVVWSPVDLKRGIYFLVIETAKSRHITKLVLVD